MLDSERIALLRESYLFANMPAPDLKRMAEAARLSRFAAGDIIFRQGEPAGVVHIIAWGSAEEHVSHGDDDVPVALLSFADVAGEECLIHNKAGRFASTVTALEETATLSVPTAAVAPLVAGGHLSGALEREVTLLARILLIKRAAPFIAVPGSAGAQRGAAKECGGLYARPRRVTGGQPR